MTAFSRAGRLLPPLRRATILPDSIPRQRTMAKVGSLSDLIRERRHLWLTCWPCHRHVRVDVPAVITAKGDMPVQRFLERSKCGRCDNRDVELTAPTDVGAAAEYRYPDYQLNSPAPHGG